jgi:hypothetical protein
MIDGMWVSVARIALLWLMTVATAVAANSMTATNTQALGFGRFAAGGGGTISINSATGARISTGSVALISSAIGSPAQFSLNGTPNLVYSITLPANGTVVLTKAGGGSMSLTQFTSTPSGTGTLSGSGQQTVSVGATITVGAGATPGSYSGVFVLTVDHN